MPARTSSTGTSSPVGGRTHRTVAHRIVKLKEVNAIVAESTQAGFNRLTNPGGRVGPIDVLEPDLRAQDDLIPGLQLAEHAPKVFFRPTLPVARRSVEVRDPRLHRSHNRAHLIGRFASGHQPAARARAETEHRHLQVRFSKIALLHFYLRSCAYRQPKCALSRREPRAWLLCSSVEEARNE